MVILISLEQFLPSINSDNTVSEQNTADFEKWQLELNSHFREEATNKRNILRLKQKMENNDFTLFSTQAELEICLRTKDSDIEKRNSLNEKIGELENNQNEFSESEETLLTQNQNLMKKRENFLNLYRDKGLDERLIRILAKQLRQQANLVVKKQTIKLN